LAERRQPLKIEVPSSKDDNVRYGRVGIIVAVGFVVGILWPRLAGIKLVPSAPTPAGEGSAEPVAEAKPGASGTAKRTEVVTTALPAPATTPEPTAKPAPAEEIKEERLRINEPQFVSCRSKQNEKVECDSIEIDTVARARLQTLRACEGTERVQGVLSLGLDLDFTTESVKRLSLGKSNTIPERPAKLLLACARAEFDKVSLTGIKHEHATYSVFYKIEFLPPGEKAGDAAAGGAEGGSDVTEASGRATVSWDVALVRSEPKKDGTVVARVLQGTRVIVSGRRGDWYRVKYDAKGNQGWVFRTAIGM
jgi:hypothetical protein